MLIERISVGGMAEVFKAKTFGVGGFEKVVALKRILPSLAEDAEFVEMFVDEAKICGQLQHANIGQVYELGRVEDTHFIAMEFIWGRDLLQVANRLRKLKRPMDPRLVALVAAGACDGLDYAHRKKDPTGRWLQIIHRDISPQNLLVSFDGEVKIVDFGIAKAALRNSKTQAGVLKGKFGYMSPEQVRGLPIDRRSDIFALGIIVWELLTGERLFTGETDFETLERVKNGAILPPSKKNPNVPSFLDAVVLKALAREVEDRYAWASEMREALLQFVHGGEAAISAKHLAGFMRELFASDLERAQPGSSKPSTSARGMDVTAGKANRPVEPRTIEMEAPQAMIAAALAAAAAAQAKNNPNPALPMRTIEMPAPSFDEPTTVESGPSGDDREGDAGTNILDPLELEAIISEPSAQPPSFTRPKAAAAPNAPIDPLAATGKQPDLASILFDDGDMPKRGVPPESANADPFGGRPSGSAPTNSRDKKTMQMQAPRLPDRRDAPTVLRPPPSLPSSGKAPSPLDVPAPTSRTTGAIPTVPRSTLLRDLAIGAVLAAVVLGAFVGGQAWYSRRSASGTLVVTAASVDGYDVDVDGRAVGHVDAQRHVTLKDMVPGPHDVVLHGPAGSRVANTIDVNSHDVTVFNAPSAAVATPPSSGQDTGKLRLQVNTVGSRVEVDGALLTDAGADQPIALRANVDHEVRVKKLGYRDIVLHVTLKPGQELNKELDFPAVPATARLEIATDPPGAEVRIEGKMRGQTPLIVDGLDPKHSVRVTLRRHGYAVTTKQVALDSLDIKLDVKLVIATSGGANGGGDPDTNVLEPQLGDNAPVATAPRPAKPAIVEPVAPTGPAPLDEEPKNPNDPGFLIANTQPWARVFVDGKDTGKTTPIPPRSRISLKPGKHSVTFVVAGKKYPYNVLIRAGEETRLLEQLGDE